LLDINFTEIDADSNSLGSCPAAIMRSSQALSTIACIALLGVLGAANGEGAKPSPAAAGATSPRPDSVAVEARMPPFPTDKEDEYLCTAVELPPGDMKLVSVEPLADMRTVHHMLLFGAFLHRYYR
jgi:hypothetical protein